VLKRWNTKRHLFSHIYWEKLVARREFDNQFDKFVIKLLNGEETVSHLPHEHSRIAWYFLARGGLIAVEVSGHQQNGDS